MRILHIAAKDIEGGAARATYRLHRGLLELGADSRMLVREKSSSDPTVTQFNPPMDWKSRILRRARREWIEVDRKRYEETRPSRCERFSDDRTRFGESLLDQLPEHDVVNLHWIGGFVDCCGMLTALASNAPVVWTLHDMNPITGGCHYDKGCGKHQQGCGACPQLGSQTPDDLSHKVWRRKREVYGALGADGLVFVPTSRWMEDQARNSRLVGKCEVRRIPYGLDTTLYNAKKVTAARRELGFSSDAKLVMFAAQGVSNPRKGFSYLKKGLAKVDDISNLVLISVGAGRPPMKTSISHHHLGYIEDDRNLSVLYSSADVFVIPSLQEAFGQTALEAISCGTPVVGFDVGGIPDMVRPGETGYLAELRDADDLARQIRRVLKHDGKSAEMSKRCREVALTEYNFRLQARRYLQLYWQMLGRWRGGK